MSDRDTLQTATMSGMHFSPIQRNSSRQIVPPVHSLDSQDVVAHAHMSTQRQVRNNPS